MTTSRLVVIFVCTALTACATSKPEMMTDEQIATYSSPEALIREKVDFNPPYWADDLQLRDGGQLVRPFSFARQYCEWQGGKIYKVYDEVRNLPYTVSNLQEQEAVDATRSFVKERLGVFQCEKPGGPWTIDITAEPDYSAKGVNRAILTVTYNSPEDLKAQSITRNESYEASQAKDWAETYSAAFKSAKTSAQFNQFIQTYQSNDPDDLVPLAIERAKQLSIEEAKIAKAAADRRAQAREAAGRDLAAFRKSLSVGNSSNCGLVVEVKGPVALVQTMNGAMWLKSDELYPENMTGCTIHNGVYRHQVPAVLSS